MYKITRKRSTKRRIETLLKLMYHNGILILEGVFFELTLDYDKVDINRKSIKKNLT